MGPELANDHLRWRLRQELAEPQAELYTTSWKLDWLVLRKRIQPLDCLDPHDGFWTLLVDRYPQFDLGKSL
jgi:hypothetical protein